MTRHSGQYARVRCDLKDHIVVVLLVAAAALTIAGWAGEAWSETNVKRVGMLSLFGRSDDASWDRLWMQRFRRHLAAQGWVEGKNVAFEYRSARGDPSQFPKACDACSLPGNALDPDRRNRYDD